MHWQFLWSLLLCFTTVAMGTKKCARGYFKCKTANMCILNSWTCDGYDDCGDSSDEKDCQTARKTCSDPAQLSNGVTSWKSGEVGSLVTSRCKPTYILIGSKIRICQSNKQWSGVPPACIKQSNKRRHCPDIGYLENGRLYGSSFAVGQIVQYECDHGYELMGAKRRLCLTNLKWSRTSPTCEMIGCTDPGNPINAVRFGQSFGKGHTIMFACINEDYEMVGKDQLTCMGRNKWSDPIPECLKPAIALSRKANEFTKSFVNRLKVLTVDGKGRSGFASEAVGLDLVFVLDYSESVGKANFRKAVQFTKSIIDEFGLSETDQGTHVAIVLFGTTPKILFSLTSQKVYQVDVALQELENIQFLGGGTGTRDALDLVLHDVANETRPAAKKVLFIITDGKHNVGGDPAPSAQQLRNILRFEIFAIGISDAVNRGELESIASLPFEKHVYLIHDFNMLEKLKTLVKSNKVDYSACGSSGDTKQRINNQQMVESNHGAWPFVIALLVRGRLTCAGVLLSKTWVLTTAKCLTGVIKHDVRVVSGMHRRSIHLGSEQRRQVKKIIFHPRNLTSDNDIALLQLYQAINFGEYSRAICTPHEYDVFYARPQKTAYVAGWGYRKKIKETLHQGNIVFKPRRKCFTQAEINKSEPQDLCAGTGKPGEGVCSGTRGSPLMVQRRREISSQVFYSWVVVGLLRKNTGCAKDHSYSSFTNVIIHRNWITDVMKRTT